MKKIFYLIAVVGLMFASCTKPENPNPNEEPTYSFSIGAEKSIDSTDETRVEYVDGLMHWSVGDQVGMYVTAESSTYSRPQNSYVNNFAMTGAHTEPARGTTFKGLLTQSQISQLDPTKTYRHFSYYPYGSMELYSTAVYNSMGVMMYHTIPPSFTVRPNEFPTDAIYMFAEEEGMNSPMTWLEGNEQKWSEKRTLTYKTYKHTMAYFRVKINSYSRNLPLGGVSIQLREYKPEFGMNITTNKIAGTGYLYSKYRQGGDTHIVHSMMEGTYDSITVYIDGTINEGDYIYIPISCTGPIYPLYEGQNGGYTRFRFTFFERDSYNSNHVFATKDPQIAPISPNNIFDPNYLYLEPGKIYDIAFNL